MRYAQYPNSRDFRAETIPQSTGHRYTYRLILCCIQLNSTKDNLITFRVSLREKDELKNITSLQGISMSELLRYLIWNYKQNERTMNHANLNNRR